MLTCVTDNSPPESTQSTSKINVFQDKGKIGISKSIFNFSLDHLHCIFIHSLSLIIRLINIDHNVFIYRALVSSPRAKGFDFFGDPLDSEGGVYSCPFNISQTCQFEPAFQTKLGEC